MCIFFYYDILSFKTDRYRIFVPIKRKQLIKSNSCSSSQFVRLHFVRHVFLIFVATSNIVFLLQTIHNSRLNVITKSIQPSMLQLII